MYDGIAKAYITKQVAIFKNGEIDKNALHARIDRANSVRRRLRERQNFLIKARDAEKCFLGLHRIIQRVRTGHPIIAIDTGFDPDIENAPIEELGLCRRAGDGTISTTTYRIFKRQSRAETAAYGPIIYTTSSSEIVHIARKICGDPDNVIVFHSSHEDRKKIGLSGGGEYADTQRIHWQLFASYLPLDELFMFYMQEASTVDWHESGNDAYNTLQIFLKMVDLYDIPLEQLMRMFRLNSPHRPTISFKRSGPPERKLVLRSL